MSEQGINVHPSHMPNVVDLLEDRVAELEAVVLLLLKSAVPHPTHHPSMWVAWRKAEDLLRIPREKSHAIQTDRRRELELLGEDYERTSLSNSPIHPETNRE